MILFVCTGNVCRSPYLELVLRNHLAQRHITSIAVRSAGTEALLHQPVAPPMAAILEQAGITTDTFRSRQLERQMVRSADLILTAERSHRSVVARLHPPALSRIFTLRQAARLLQFAPLDAPFVPEENAVSRLARLIASGRGLNQPSAGDGDDVMDPWQQSASTYRAVEGMLKEPLAVLANALAAQRTAPSFVAGD
ncbi:arsenate reductase/protein-tyrosine-phosphatase family protein [Mycetocola manganoxydans]|nr:low molecular weight phosphatase family protein [Mycetocola manganoxydans]